MLCDLLCEFLGTQGQGNQASPISPKVSEPFGILSGPNSIRNDEA